MKFENQFNAIFRNLTEKVEVLFLFMHDYEFSKEILFNDSNRTDSELYHKLTKQKKIKERIEDNLKKINLDQYLKSVYGFLNESNLKTSYELSSLFIHTNNLNGIFKYYIEKDGLNIDPRHNSGSYLNYRLDFAIEYILLVYSHLYESLKIKGVQNLSKKNLELIYGYYRVIIEDKYKK